MTRASQSCYVSSAQLIIVAMEKPMGMRVINCLWKIHTLIIDINQQQGVADR